MVKAALKRPLPMGEISFNGKLIEKNKNSVIESPKLELNYLEYLGFTSETDKVAETKHFKTKFKKSSSGPKFTADIFASNLAALITEREYYVKKKIFQLESYKYLITWSTDKKLWLKRYPTDDWKKSHQRALISICLNEYKLPRSVFHLLLQHITEEQIPGIKELVSQLLVSAEEGRLKWQAAASQCSADNETLLSLMTGVRPITVETVIRMRKLQEYVDPYWHPTVSEPIKSESDVSEPPKKRNKMQRKGSPKKQ